jgi:small-conductance mechanosensitive channel
MRILTLLAITFLWINSVFAQESISIDSISPIKKSLIPDYEIKADNRILEIKKILVDTTELFEWKSKTTSLETTVENKSKVLDSINVNTLSSVKLEKWLHRWDVLSDNIKDLQTNLNNKISLFESLNLELDYLYHLWLKTSLDIKDADISQNIKDSVKTTKYKFRTLRKQVKDEENLYLTLKYKLNSLLNEVTKQQKQIKAVRENIVKNLLVAEEPVLWEAINNQYKDTSETKHTSVIKETEVNIKIFLKNNHYFIYLTLLVFIFILFLLIFIQKSIKKSVSIEDIKTSAISSVKLVLNRPVVISLLLMWLYLSLFFKLPVEIKSIVLIIMLIPLIIQIKETFGRFKLLSLIMFLFYYLFISTRFLFDSYPLLSRFIYLSIDIFSITVIINYIRKKEYFEQFKGTIGLIKAIFYVEVVIFSTSAVFFISGNVILATMLLSGAVGVILAGIILYSLYSLLYSMIVLIFESYYLKKLNVVKQYSVQIKKSLKKILAFFMLIYWFSLSLSGFEIKSEVFSALKTAYTHQFTIGSTSFGINNIVAFFLAIYISIWFSRILIIFLKEDVFARSNTDKGVSSTITLLLRYSIITFGFIFALAAAGIELEKISIVLGALGVGIGFGLQDIFKNLFSGLILAFERPIKEDDIIQIDDLSGTVKEIGFRSSTIRTFDGSDVIVPNGDIVSNRMINWTLSDRKRRLKINIGTSFDSDPELVLQLLKESALEHPNVEHRMSPIPRFLGYGESTMDFQILFWITDYDVGFSTGTKVMVNIHRKLKENNIKIPYPKRDVVIVKE